jgi:hypothetical protein
MGAAVPALAGAIRLFSLRHKSEHKKKYKQLARAQEGKALRASVYRAE